METRFVVKTTMTRKIMSDFQKIHQPEWLRVLLWVLTAAYALNTVVSWVMNSAIKVECTVYMLLFLAILLFGHYVSGWFAYRGSNKATGEITYRFGEDVLETSCAVQEIQTQYSAFVKLVENRRYYVLYVQKRAAHILPKAAFVRGDAGDFQKFICQKTGLPMNQIRR